MARKVFIDGDVGTTGLQIRERLERRGDVALVRIDPSLRKDIPARLAAFAEAEVAILCLPDAAAKEVVAACDAAGLSTRIIDASTAHRTHPDWCFGFAEMAPDQRAAISRATRVTNPGCWSTCAIALIRPLVDAGLIDPAQPPAISGVSGYSGGGKAMIEQYESGQGPVFDMYGLSLTHKHVPELQLYAGLTVRPIFVPSVGNYRQGMLVSVPLHLDALPARPKAADLEAVLAARYAGSEWVSVIPSPLSEPRKDRIEPEADNGTNRLELRVYANETYRQAVLVARLDNLGKGASGAAVQNMGLMLGVS